MIQRPRTPSAEDQLDLLDALRLHAHESSFASADAASGLATAVQNARIRASEMGESRLNEALSRISHLLDVWECLTEADGGSNENCQAFLVQSIDRLSEGARTGRTPEAASWVLNESSRRWGDYLALVDPSCALGNDETPEDGFLDDEFNESATPGLDVSELMRRLTCVGNPASSIEELGDAAGVIPDGIDQPTIRPELELSDRSEVESAPEAAASGERGLSSHRDSILNQARSIEIDDELKEIYVADVSDLSARIQEATLNLGCGEDSERIRELGRCLHTLKGASGTVGMTELSAAIHELEGMFEQVGGAVNDSIVADIERALTLVDDVVAVLGQHTPIDRGSANHDAPARLSRSAPSRSEQPEACPSQPRDTRNPDDATDSDGLIRVPSARFEELLEAASELIARRRFWVEQAEELKRFSVAAKGCGQRLRSSIERLESGQEFRDYLSPRVNGLVSTSHNLGTSGLIQRLTEQSEDLNALAATAREASIAMVDEGEALTRLSTNLWDTLQAVRVLPIRNLFQRLTRAAREAARVEDRQIEILLKGEETGADRPLLDQLYEPMLHVVRNAVGHGIEGAETRVRTGKSSVGRITLEARREGNSLVVTVEDDGRGLDEVAIMEKAQRLGLVATGEHASPERIRSLIFHPGFSTRTEANAISGRGVGMDVVAQEVARLRGRIEMDSRQGAGTRLTIRLPSRLALEHMMLVRVDHQIYGIPIPLIESVHAGTEVEFDGFGLSGSLCIGDRTYPTVDSRSVLSVRCNADVRAATVLIVQADGKAVAILVDGIDGPRELIIKPLRSLLSGHPAISGTSLTTGGEVVLALDVTGLTRLALAGATSHRFHRDVAESAPLAPVLVVDDSLSVRRVTSRHLRSLGFAIDEASDGEQALGMLRDRRYRLILSDLEMPRMDGFGLLAELGRTGLLKSTAVIIASTLSDPETRRRALDMGATAVLAKPMSALELTQAVAPFLIGIGSPNLGAPMTLDS